MTAKKSSQIIALGGGGVGLDKFNLAIDNYKIKLDYLELRNEKDLTIFKKNKKFRLFVAYHINNVRLIDNF